MQVNQWIDVHAHFTPPMTAEQSDARWAAMQKADWVGTKPDDWSPQAALAYMNRAGIAMQMLSNIPASLEALRASNDYGARLVKQYPTRFGLLVALPTDDPQQALEEIRRGADELDADGFAVTFCYNGVYLSDPSLEPVWAELNRRRAPVFAHPNAYAPGSFGRPSPVIEVAFETTRTVVDMLYRGVFRRHPDFKLVLAHCGAALPALSGRLLLLGTEPWVPNPQNISQSEMRKQLGALYVDTAMTGSVHTIAPAMAMTGCEHIVYGSDCGVPCTREGTALANLQALMDHSGLSPEQVEQVGRNALALFPAAAKRMHEAEL
ncbi:amidohydrolase family protein [Pseudomonas frederiksbergensis]|uniref:6-methylsalicylate decarboxylase n=1 Tax=Pseudomonas frederiksbergensis TaxID=104087 RepID=A0A423KG67_9PSED|nr:amidohydrolase family protein [Pseudomonas frederiksbergensis]RON51801.1 amidohydrolase 2 [Pseudomonas frederiksbergensis]